MYSILHIKICSPCQTLKIHLDMMQSKGLNGTLHPVSLLVVQGIPRKREGVEGLEEPEIIEDPPPQKKNTGHGIN